MGSLTCLLGRTGGYWQTQHMCQALVQSLKLSQSCPFPRSSPCCLLLQRLRLWARALALLSAATWSASVRCLAAAW